MMSPATILETLCKKLQIKQFEEHLETEGAKQITHIFYIEGNQCPLNAG